MTNSPLSAPSRAASLPLVGSELALDFTNTSSGRGTARHLEHLNQPDDIIGWACHARILTPFDGDRLRLAAENGGVAAQLLQRTLALRERVHAIASALAQDRLPSHSDVKELTRTHAQCIGRAQLVLYEASFVWTWDPKEAPIEAVLGPIALSALALLTQADLSRIKQCNGDHCGWLFFDTTKNKSRRWCEMEVCGNRAKQKRHQKKQKA
jgi:predicted RNA-binding Zn ribbon-like protein